MIRKLLLIDFGEAAEEYDAFLPQPHNRNFDKGYFRYFPIHTTISCQ